MSSAWRSSSRKFTAVRGSLWASSACIPEDLRRPPLLCHFALAPVPISLLLSYAGFLNCSQLKYKMGGDGHYVCLVPLPRPVSLQHRDSVRFLSVHIVWKYFKLQAVGPALIHQHMKEKKTIHTTKSMKT